MKIRLTVELEVKPTKKKAPTKDKKSEAGTPKTTVIIAQNR